MNHYRLALKKPIYINEGNKTNFNNTRILAPAKTFSRLRVNTFTSNSVSQLQQGARKCRIVLVIP